MAPKLSSLIIVCATGQPEMMNLAAFSPLRAARFPQPGNDYIDVQQKKGPTNQKSGIVRQSRVCRSQESWRRRKEIEHRSTSMFADD